MKTTGDLFWSRVIFIQHNEKEEKKSRIGQRSNDASDICLVFNFALLIIFQWVFFSPFLHNFNLDS